MKEFKVPVGIQTHSGEGQVIFNNNYNDDEDADDDDNAMMMKTTAMMIMVFISIFFIFSRPILSQKL
jgi:hypothetical protein